MTQTIVTRVRERISLFISQPAPAEQASPFGSPGSQEIWAATLLQSLVVPHQEQAVCAPLFPGVVVQHDSSESSHVLAVCSSLLLPGTVLWNQDSAASQATPDEIVHRFIDLVEPVGAGGQFDPPLGSQGHEL